MIPQSHGVHFTGLFPYAKLRKTARGWHGFVSDNWRVFMVEDKFPEDPLYKYVILEGPSKQGGLYERYRMREAFKEDGEPFLMGLGGKGFVIALPQEIGLWGDWCLYHCLSIPFKVKPHWGIN